MPSGTLFFGHHALQVEQLIKNVVVRICRDTPGPGSILPIDIAMQAFATIGEIANQRDAQPILASIALIEHNRFADLNDQLIPLDSQLPDPLNRDISR